MIDVYIFRIKLLNIRIASYDFFVSVDELTPAIVRMLLGPGINAVMQREN